ncbi:hypothetical protein JHK87_047867 [Glycine soja]|nr:hypothetical protein JHK87_047867 [Glycine soja]
MRYSKAVLLEPSLLKFHFSYSLSPSLSFSFPIFNSVLIPLLSCSHTSLLRYALSTFRAKEEEVERKPCVKALPFKEVCVEIYKGVTTSQLNELVAETTAAMIANHPDYSSIANYLSWQKGFKMSWNPHMEVHYNTISYPYNTTGSFIEYFEGLTYEHVNFIFYGESHAQSSYPSKSSFYKFGLSEPENTSHYRYGHDYEVNHHEPVVDEYRRPSENSLTINEKSAACGKWYLNHYGMPTSV